MELRFNDDDLKPESRKKNTSTIKFSDLNEQAQRACEIAGRGTYHWQDTYNAIYPPKKKSETPKITGEQAVSSLAQEFIDLCKDRQEIVDGMDKFLDNVWDQIEDKIHSLSDTCPECEGEMTTVMVPDKVGKGLHEEKACSNPDCPSHGEDYEEERA